MGNREWLPLRSADEALYTRYFARVDDDLSYENNWAFICQESRNGALRYRDGDMLLTGVKKHPNSPFMFVFSCFPTGVFNASAVCTAGAALARQTRSRVVFRKCSERFSHLITSGSHGVLLPPNTFSLQNDVPEDVFPQAIVSVGVALAAVGSSFVKIRNHVKYFTSRHSPEVRSLTPQLIPRVYDLIHNWNDSRAMSSVERSGAHGEVDVSAYTLFARDFAARVDDINYFSVVSFVGLVPVGFAFAGRTGRRVAALYSCISVTDYRGSSEFLMSKLFERLAAAGIALLNLGGSETEGLYRFKTKYGGSRLRPSFDIELLTDRSPTYFL